MKSLFVLVLLTLVPLLNYGADKQAAAFKQEVWGAAGEPFAKLDVPAEWEGYGAVIIAQDFLYRYEYLKPNRLKTTEISHIRMKLQDASSLEGYSEFYYSELYYPERGFGGAGKTYVGFKVIKADGSESEISLDGAVISSQSEWELEKKIAIPNLEKGDIIDFYYVSVEEFGVASSFIFGPVVARLNDEYPVMQQSFRFETEKYFFINFGAMNGGPELKKQASTDKKLDRFYVETGLAEPTKGLLWEYDYRTYPTIKFQVVYAKKGERGGIPAFLGAPGNVKSNVNPTDIVTYLEQVWDTETDEEEELAAAFTRYLKFNGISNLSQEEELEAFYYFLRFRSLSRSMSPYLELGPYDNNEIVAITSNYLRMKGIDHQLLVAVSRTLGDLDDLVIKDETEFILKIGDNYIEYVDDHSRFGEFSTAYEFTTAWLVNVTDPVSQWKAEPYKLGFSSHKENSVHANLKVDFDEEDQLNLRIVRENSFKGKSRRRVIWNMLLPDEYYDDDRKKYMIRYRPAEKQAEVEGVDLQEERLESVEALISSDFDIEIEELHNFEILENGRSAGLDSLHFTEDFTIGGLVKKAGNNLLLQAGMLIGSQIELGDEEKERKSDVYMPYARSFTYEINVVIPDGYTVEGIEKLHFDVINETGGFSSTAEMKDGLLHIKTNKFYKDNFVKLEDWPKMIEFLEAAYTFTQQKVLLKKK